MSTMYLRAKRLAIAGSCLKHVWTVRSEAVQCPQWSSAEQEYSDTHKVHIVTLHRGSLW